MKITDLLDSYADMSTPFPSVDLPDSETTIARTREKLGLPRKRRRKIPVKLLTAACLVLALTATAAAVGFSVWERAWQDAGIETDIPEYTEYRDLPTISEAASWNSAAITEVTDASVELVSTICAWKNLTAYLRVTPVSSEIADADTLQGNWEIGGMPEATGAEPVDGLTFLGARQLAYDAETQSALLCLSLSSDALEQATAFSVDLFWNAADSVQHFGRITLPITLSEALCFPMELSLENSFFPDTAALSEVQLGANYIRFTLDIPTNFSQWCAEHGEEAAWNTLGDAYWGYFDRQNGTEPAETYTELDARVAFARSWEAAIAGAAGETTIVLLDRSEISLADAQSNGGEEDDSLSRMTREYLLPAPLDLTQVSGISIDGVFYSVIPT